MNSFAKVMGLKICNLDNILKNSENVVNSSDETDNCQNTANEQMTPNVKNSNNKVYLLLQKLKIITLQFFIIQLYNTLLIDYS